MSLELGQLPFRPDTTPYRSPEARRRRRKRDRLAAKAAAGLPVAPLRRITTHSGLEGDTFSTCGQLSIMPHALAPTDVDFQLGATQDRMGRSFAAAAVSHVVGVGLILLLISLSPERVYDIVEPNREHYGLVWLPAEGPGGGGGGGGNQSLEAPRQVELEGPDESALSVPVEPESDYVEPELQEETLQTQRLNIPAVSISSAPQTTPGVLEGFSARATLSQGSGTGGGGGTGEGTGAGPGIGPGLGPGQGGGVGGDLYRPGSGVSVPQVINRATPEYTSEAMRANIQGGVRLEVVVLPDGTVGDVTVTKSLDRVFGLDQEAIKCARRWRFAPGTRFGEPVPVLVSLEISFRLH